MHHIPMPARDIAVIEIRVLTGPEAGRSCRFSKSPITLGRAATNDFPLPADATVSQHHAQLAWEDGAWTLHDAGSKNGAFVEQDGARIEVRAATAVRPGQVFFLGSTQMAYEMVRAPETGQVHPSAVQKDTATLRIYREGRDAVFEWTVSAPLQVRHRIPWPEAELRALLQQWEALVSRANALRESPEPASGGLEEEMAALGRLMRDQLTPAKLRKVLDEAAPHYLTLVVDPALSAVPWELVATADAPWCVARALGRQVLLDYQSIAIPTRHDRESPAVLIVCNPTGDLPEAQAEGEALLETLIGTGRFGPIEFLAGARVRKLDLLRRLESADWVYYLGHGDADPVDPANSGWRLQGGRLTCRQFRTLSSPPALVFANACDSGREVHTGQQLTLPEHGAGMATSLLLAGVSHYLGAVWPIPAESSTDFATCFFQQVLAGTPVGEAVRMARRTVRAQQGAPDLLWASYVLYGDPAATLLPTAAGVSD